MRRIHSLQKVDDLGRPSRIRRPFRSCHTQLSIIAPAWRETGYFTLKERAALELVEAVTLISDGQLPDTTYEHAATRLSAAEIAAIEWLAVVINAWNRIAIFSRLPVNA